MTSHHPGAISNVLITRSSRFQLRNLPPTSTMMATSTMTTTRRSSRSGNQPSGEFLQGQKCQEILVERVEKLTRLGKNADTCFDLLKRVLASATQGFWWRISPVDGYDDDISVGFGVEWCYLLPLLIKCGLMRCRVIKDLQVNVVAWKSMSQSLSALIRLEITSNPTHFLCIGKARYKNPREQQKKCPLSFWTTIASPAPRQLMIEIKQVVAKAMLDDRSASRNVVQNGQNDVQNDQEQGQEEEEELEQETALHSTSIDFAMALDLDRRPRLSRTNAGTYYVPTIMTHVLFTNSINCLSISYY